MDDTGNDDSVNKNSHPLKPIITIGTQKIIVIDKSIIGKVDSSLLFRQELTEDGAIVLTPVKTKGPGLT